MARSPEMGPRLAVLLDGMPGPEVRERLEPEWHELYLIWHTVDKWEMASVAVLADARVRSAVTNRAELLALIDQIEPDFGSLAFVRRALPPTSRAFNFVTPSGQWIWSEGVPSDIPVADGISRPRPATPLPARSRAFGPIRLQPGDRFILGHRGHLGLGDTDLRHQQMHQISRQSLFRRCWFAPVRPDAVLHAAPEGCLVDIKLIAEDVLPDTRSVVGPVHRMRNAGPQNSTIHEVELVGDVVRAGPPASVTNPLPLLDFAKGLVILAGRRRP